VTSRFERPCSPVARRLLNAYRDRSWTPDSNNASRYYKWSHMAGLAGALRALADHRPQRRSLDGPRDHWDPDERTRRELRNIAAELEERQ
jgi:hypothetical protein